MCQTLRVVAKPYTLYVTSKVNVPAFMQGRSAHAPNPYVKQALAVTVISENRRKTNAIEYSRGAQHQLVGQPRNRNRFTDFSALEVTTTRKGTITTITQEKGAGVAAHQDGQTICRKTPPRCCTPSGA